MKLMNALVAVVALSSGVAMAAGKEKNCEVKGKLVHKKDQATCEKGGKGTWKGKAADAAAAPAPAAAPAEAPAAAPAEGHQ